MEGGSNKSFKLVGILMIPTAIKQNKINYTALKLTKNIEYYLKKARTVTNQNNIFKKIYLS